MVEPLRVSLFALVSCALLGCTTMRSVTSNELEGVIAALEPGDRVSVLTAAGWRERLNVVAVTDTTLELETWENTPVTVARADLWELQVPTPSPGKRAIVVGVSVSVGVLALFLSAGYELDY